MATIYKRGGNKNRDGRWYITYSVRPGVRRTVKGCRDKAATEALAKKLETEAWERGSGLIDARADQYARAELTPLATKNADGMVTGGHLAEFHATLLAKGTTAKQAELVLTRAAKVLELTKAVRISELLPSAVQVAMAHLRDAEDRSLQTCNHYLRAIKQFSRWLRRDGRCRDDALAHLAGYNVKLDRRHDRRSLSDDELALLIEAAQGGKRLCGLVGPTRAMLYRLAVETGLRASELGSLTPESFDLTDLDEAAVTVAAGYSKHRRQDVLPLRRDVAEALAEFLADKLPGRPAFPMPDKPVKMVQRDLAAARAKWLSEEGLTDEERKRRNESSFLAYRDTAGRVADFHALRHTFITRLAQSGIAPSVAKSLARHSTITLTIDRYTHTVIGDQRQALAVLPVIGAKAEQQEQALRTAVGGESVVADGRERAAQTTALTHQNSPKRAIDGHDRKGTWKGQRRAQMPANGSTCEHSPSSVTNTPDRTRTCDLRFRKPPLYPTELRARNCYLTSTYD